MSKASHLAKMLKYLEDVSEVLRLLQSGDKGWLTVAKLQRLKKELEALMVEFDHKDHNEQPYVNLKEIHEAVAETLDQTTTVQKNALEMIREMRQETKKALRGAERRHYHQTTTKPILCIRCKKKPKHFGDYCKRCANDLGIRPTGKVI